jgi:hypothetical protein
MNILLIIIICIVILNYYFDNSYIKKVYKYLKGIGVIILFFLLYKYYGNADLKESIIQSISKVDKVPIDRTYSDIGKFLSKKSVIDFDNSNSITTSNKPIQNTNSSDRTKRNVTNGQKKYIASIQKWRCGHCNELLDASYEVDHILALYKGGTNELNNLVALCRNCHGIKTTKERLNLD